MHRSAFLPFALAFSAAALIVLPALGTPKKPRVRYHDARSRRPSQKYANMSKSACLKELSTRKISFKNAASSRGVLAPVRLTADVSGVTFRTSAPANERAVSPAEVFDCRLVLALSDWSKILVSHGIDEARTITAWRPPKKSVPESKLAVRHPGGLAVDVESFAEKAKPGQTKRKWIHVVSDFHGKIGAPVCGPFKRSLPAAEKKLRAIVCDAKSQGLFTSILTPSYDRAHRDHFHVEVRPNVEWSLLL